MSAVEFASLFLPDGSTVGFDGTQVDGQTAIQRSLAEIFADHEPANYVGIVREVRFLVDDVGLLRAVAGMVAKGETELNENLAIQSLVAVRRDGAWKIGLWQNTPAALHGRL